MTEQEFNNILITRTDRIGDVVLSLPMITVLRSNFPSARISMLLRSSTRELAEGYPGLDSTLAYDQTGKPKSFLHMLREIRAARFDLAVLSYPTFRLAMLLVFSGIRNRVGTGYRWYSFLFNDRVYEHRKTAEKHELEYNLSLLRSINARYDQAPEFALSIPKAADVNAQNVRREMGILDSDELFILHPGSGGSARDWSLENFARLARLLTESGLRVVVTGGPGEESLVQSVVGLAGRGVISLVNRFSLMELAAFVRTAAVFVSSSTGPLHIAAAVGTPVVGLYPPIRACSPERWGPYTKNKIVFVPNEAACPLCKGKPCQGSECMNQITVEEVLRAVKNLRSGVKKSHAALTQQ